MAAVVQMMMVVVTMTVTVLLDAIMIMIMIRSNSSSENNSMHNDENKVNNHNSIVAAIERETVIPTHSSSL